ncbi:hypothetical protein ACNKFW_15380 (plasmid) [Paracoccus sp. TD-10]|uniref:hypothetical protein n=1 Tax=Paracoccus sp. TD-10 TaxID=3395918 RepID=UPI003AADA78C
MTPIDTAELERLAESITPGPWNSSIHGSQVLTGDSWNTICEIRVRKDFSAAQWEDGRGSSDPTANARAIALVPALIHEVLAHRKAGESMNGRAVMTIYACPTPQEITSWAESALRNVPDGSLTRAFMRELIADFADGLSALRTTPEVEGGCDAE